MRKKEYVRVPGEWGGRDAGKTFEITEAPATAAEKWAWRLIIALKGTTGEIPEGIAHLGYVAIAIRGFNAFLASDVDYAKLEPLLDEMMDCVRIVRDPSSIDKATGDPVATSLMSDGSDIEEIRTLGWLRSEVLRIHTGFSFTGALSTWASFMKSPEGSENT